jgi:hypothetical protein
LPLEQHGVIGHATLGSFAVAAIAAHVDLHGAYAARCWM